MADQKPDQGLLEQEAYRRVRDALQGGSPRKKAFSDVARAMAALGFLNRQGSPLKGASIENLYYKTRRKKRGARR